MASVLEEVCEGEGSGLERFHFTGTPICMEPFPLKEEKPAHLPVT